MLDAVLGLLAPDIALDLGSSRTRLFVRGEGVVQDVATAVAVRTWRSGRRQVVALGDEAQGMLGRTPDGLEVVRPVRAGQVVDRDVAAALVTHLVRRVHGGGLVGPRAVVAITRDAPDRTRRGIRGALEALGARAVHLVPKPLAAAVGAELGLDHPTGQMIVDLGGGTTHIAVLCSGEIIASTTLEVGGDVLDGAVLRCLRRNHDLEIGQPTAERIKRRLGSVGEPVDDVEIVAGRCLRRGIPRAVEVSGEEIAAALREPVAAIGAAIRRVLEQTPTEAAGDVVDHGVLLTGGGSALRDVDVALRAATGLAVLLTEAPAQAVVRGVGHLAEDPEQLERVLV